MSNDINILERIFKLWAKISMLIVEGKRDPQKIASVLQKILETPDLLCFHSTFRLLAVTGWNAKKAFTTGKWYLECAFVHCFIIDKNVDVAEIALRTHRIMQNTGDQYIRAELGAEFEEIQLGQFHSFLMTKADRCVWYLAFVRDVNGTLRVVFARWYGDGWQVDTCLVGNKHSWSQGYVVISRDPGTLEQ